MTALGAVAYDDPVVSELIEREAARQNATLNLIAAESTAPPAVLRALGSVFNNKPAEGYPGRRYHRGCEIADEVEVLAVDRAKALFGSEHANVQVHSGAQANMAAPGQLDPGVELLGDASRGGGGTAPDPRPAAHRGCSHPRAARRLVPARRRAPVGGAGAQRLGPALRRLPGRRPRGVGHDGMVLGRLGAWLGRPT